MMYEANKIEKKWQKYWDEHETFKTDVWDFSKPKFYCLDMFPYPSGQGLHVGHPEGYTATDIVSRYKRMRGFNVLHPMGWDAFGLPAEQYAINTGNHPAGFTENNIQTFKRQLKMLGFSYDWSKEVSTADPKFYKWTQWIFKQLYEDGYAKCVDMPVNWCEELGTVLANDEVIDGKSERGGYPVIRKNMRQWVLTIPKYAEKLLEGLEKIDWPESTKEMQKNWIGKSVGAHVDFKIAGTDLTFTVFTTRPDTLFGATYCVMAPEHEYVDRITTDEQKEQVNAYKLECAKKSDLERTELNKEKTGVFTGAYAINPVNGKEIPIWISDYVLAGYGTGAIMAVPAHDTRDYEFAKKFDIPIIQVLEEVTGTPHEGETKKNSIVAILYDEENDKYLTVHWHEMGGRLFIGGTMKEGETPLDCATREIKEETGYKDIELVHELPKINHHYYAYNKDKYFNIESTGFLFKLVSNVQEEQNLDDDEKFDLEWVDKDTIMAEVNDGLHKKTFEYALVPGAMEGDGIHIHSEFLDGLGKQEAIDQMIAWLEEHHVGKKQINYHLRDWIFARQRYWGEPIPIVHFEDGSMKALDDSELPLVLPELEDYRPSKNGDSPLEKATDWVHVTVDGKKAKRETSTMPGSAGSSWYFLRYIDPNNDHEIADKKLLEHWLPVDLYVGGPEHAVGHLLYSRFWNHYLYDKGIVPVEEPFQTLRHQGMILGSNGEKMSKSRGNVINPDDIVKEYGADTLRVYEMFMGPLEASKPWDTKGVEGARRFLDRVYRYFMEEHRIREEENKNLEKIYHATVKKVTNDYETLNFNTAISQMMIFVNALYKEEFIPKEYAEGFIKLLSPVAPHIAEEIWHEALGHENTITYEAWPTYEESKLVEDTYTMVVQVNGKVRGKIEVNTNASKEEMETLAKEIENVKKNIEGKEIVKVITIPAKLVNIVVK